MTLLTFKNKYVIQSSTNVATSSTSFVDDTASIQTFSLASPQTVLVIYESWGQANGNSTYGCINAINIDGVDRAISRDGSGYTSPWIYRNMPFWIGTLSAGSHTIKGRVSVPNSAYTYTIRNRILLIYIFDGNEFYYIDDSSHEIRWTEQSGAGSWWSVPRDDPYATVTFTPSGPCKALYMYNASNNGQDYYSGKIGYINVGGTDYSAANKSTNSSAGSDSVFTCHASSLTAVSTTAKGRIKGNDTNYMYVDNRQFGILLFDNSTILDSVTSDVQFSTTSNALVNDSQATISRITTDTRELLVVAMATKRHGTSSSYSGENYDISVDGIDKQSVKAMGNNTGYAPIWSESEPTCYAQTLSPGSHTIQGRLSNNVGSDNAVVDSRRIFALWLSIPPGSLNISSTPSGASIYLDGSGTPSGTTANTLIGISVGSHNIRLSLAGYYDWTGSAIVSSGTTTPISATFAGSANISSTPSGARVWLAQSPDSPIDQGIGKDTPIIITNLTDPTPSTTKLWNYKLTKAAYIDSTGSFTATAGSTTPVSVILIPSAGNITISSTPSGARIYIDNVDQGVNTPSTISNLTPVSHSIKLTIPNYNDYITNVMILSNQTISINPILTLSAGSTKIQASQSFVQSSYQGEIIDIGTLKFDWNGTGTIILEKTIIYDRLVLTGSNGTFDHTWTPCGSQIAEGPFDITSIFATGYNEINIKIYNVCGSDIGTVTGSIDITGPITLACPITPKYSGNTVTLQATPKDGIGPYYVEFRKDGLTIDSSRLEGLDNPIYNAPEDVQITRTYTLDDIDIASALSGTIDFEVYMSDSCPTEAKICDQVCTIDIGCLAPVCNFTVT